jgi:hypothetical protein
MRRSVWGFFAAGLALVVAAPVHGQPGNWSMSPATSEPSPRTETAMAFDALHHNVVLFGGLDSITGVLGDTWVWDGGTWTQRFPTASPSPRMGHAMAYDVARGEVLLFGGSTSGDETWTWDGDNWTLRLPATSPAGRVDHSLAYDAVRERVVLFAGRYGGAFTELDDTWTWSGNDWVQQLPTQRPGRRFDHAMTFDEVRGEVVMFGGNAAGPVLFDDTWTWDGVDWVVATPATSPGFHGDHAMSFGPFGQVVLFGGGTQQGTTDDTWTWDGVTWTLENPAQRPPPRQNHAMAYDRLRDRIVMFGEPEARQSEPSNTWEWFDGSGAGTGAIEITMNLPTATFTVYGPISFGGSGTSFSRSGVPVGTYSIIYGDVSGYMTPPSSSQTLDVGETVHFDARYVRLPRLVPTFDGNSVHPFDVSFAYVSRTLETIQASVTVTNLTGTWFQATG